MQKRRSILSAVINNIIAVDSLKTIAPKFRKKCLQNVLSIKRHFPRNIVKTFCSHIYEKVFAFKTEI